MPGTRVTVTGIYTIFQNKAAYVRPSPRDCQPSPHACRLDGLTFRVCFLVRPRTQRTEKAKRRHRSGGGGDQTSLLEGRGFLHRFAGHWPFAELLQVRTNTPPHLMSNRADPLTLFLYLLFAPQARRRDTVQTDGQTPAILRDGVEERGSGHLRYALALHLPERRP